MAEHWIGFDCVIMFPLKKNETKEEAYERLKEVVRSAGMELTTPKKLFEKQKESGDEN